MSNLVKKYYKNEFNNIELNILYSIYSNLNLSINKRIEKIYKEKEGDELPVSYSNKNNLLIEKDYPKELKLFQEVAKKIAKELNMVYEENPSDNKNVDKNSLVFINIDLLNFEHHLLNYLYSEKKDDIFNIEYFKKSGGIVLILENIQIASKLMQSKVLGLINDNKNIYIGLTSKKDIKNINSSLMSRMEILYE